MGIESVVLEDHGNVAVLGRNIIHHPVSDDDFSGIGLLQPCDHSEGSGFAATRGADQDDKLLVLHIQVEVLDGYHLIELLAHIC